MRAEYAAHQSHEAQLVADGAGADVVDPSGLEHGAVDEVVRAFPRLQFNARSRKRRTQSSRRVDDATAPGAALVPYREAHGRNRVVCSG